ncbi:MAG TPA: hypothetical protein VNY31_06280 [Solirubrobacteraceae bacterium]|jgi:hypothetical protein|nr:hypothetical protein [Solirubrobacteraceae bacterium]
MVTLAVGVALLAAASAVALTRSPPRVARVGVPVGDASDVPLGKDLGDMTICQSGETLPAGVSGIRIGMWAFLGAKMHVRIYSGSRILTEGSRGPNWTSDSVTVPIKPVDHQTSGVKVCIGIGPNSQPLMLLGAETPARESAVATLGVNSPTPAAAASSHAQLGGKIGLEYLAAGRGSWWSRVVSVVKHMGLGRAYTGSWIALLVAALMAAIGVLAIRLTLRTLP